MTDLCYPSCEQPQTRRGQERRLALLICATDLFLERGYDAVSLDDIVHHAGGSKTSIYKYFGNKEGLFTAICDYRRQEGIDGPGETRTLLKAFSDFVESEDLPEESAREKTQALVSYSMAQAKLGEPITLDELSGLIDEDRDIAILVLAAGSTKEGPGPLVSMIAGRGAAFPIPVTVLPDTLTNEEIDALC